MGDQISEDWSKRLSDWASQTHVAVLQIDTKLDTVGVKVDSLSSRLESIDAQVKLARWFLAIGVIALFAWLWNLSVNQAEQRSQVVRQEAVILKLERSVDKLSDHVTTLGRSIDRLSDFARRIERLEDALLKPTMQRREGERIPDE